jgi:hypothetical protein
MGVDDSDEENLYSNSEDSDDDDGDEDVPIVRAKVR